MRSIRFDSTSNLTLSIKPKWFCKLQFEIKKLNQHYDFKCYISIIFTVKNNRHLTNTSILNPHVHLLGDDAAAIAYVRVTQTIDK